MNRVPIDSLQLHPKAGSVPLPNQEDMKALRSSLEKDGQQDPVHATDQGVILDGRTRWLLLKELGALEIDVQWVAPPDELEYIVGRAVNRRHLTPEQKRELNALLREQVIDVVPHPVTGEDVRLGRGRPERAELLGVNKDTVERWDEDAKGANAPFEGPTHTRNAAGAIKPLHYRPRKPDSRGKRIAPPIQRGRPAPAWHRHFTLWCRKVLPEDKQRLLAMSSEIHKALRHLNLTCEEDSNGYRNPAPEASDAHDAVA